MAPSYTRPEPRHEIVIGRGEQGHTRKGIAAGSESLGRQSQSQLEINCRKCDALKSGWLSEILRATF